MTSADEIIEAFEVLKTTIKEQNETIYLFAAYLEIAADKGALDQDCHAVIKAKELLKRS